ncbi:MAG: branched-chain amino acid transaminase [Candidatus Velthaea sp.]
MDLSGLSVYADGRFSRYDEAKVGLLTHGLQYGTGCFEGVRGFWSQKDDELYLLHVREHFERLEQSAKILMIALPHSVDELTELTVDLVVRNGFKSDIYIRPCTFKSSEEVGVRLHDVKDSFAIVAIPFSKYFDAAAGLKCGSSSWRRIDDVSTPARGKITGAYVNSALAKSEAILNGFDEAIMLSHDGHVSEGSAENLFMVRGGVIYTPDPSQNILEGITRKTVMTLAKNELGLDVVERAIDRSEIYGADEMFLSGSAAGVQWIESVDHRKIGTGSQGPIARKIMDLYARVTRGELPQYADWLIKTYASRKVAV